MPDIVNVKYQQTGQSVNIDDTGMRPMAARAYEYRDALYLLIKPPASGKSRALMFITLDKFTQVSHFIF